MATRVMDWYDQTKREMPWRDQEDPYKIWLSEIMLQQTQITTVIDYYHRWLERFPRIEDVASASIDEVLKYWEGLGYYSRARNFHKSCQEIVDAGGKIPRGIKEFQELKGVGPYIAAAVQSIAFNVPASVVDGNINRVASRFNAFSKPPLQNKKDIQRFMDNMLDKKRPGDFNQAMMDLGRYICKPQNPLCNECPLEESCIAHKTGDQDMYPAKVAKKARPHYDVAVGIICDGSKLLITKRKQDGLLGGLWEFPGGKIKNAEKIEFKFEEDKKIFDPKEVYKDEPNPTKL